MPWIKRNLYFLIGSVAAMVLLGTACWFLYQRNRLNNEAKEKLDGLYAESIRLNKQDPHWGSERVDNIQAARDQQQQLRGVVRQCEKHFQRIPPIPDMPKVTDARFAGQLSRTIDQLQREANNASVTLPPKYSFSFESVKGNLNIAAASLAPLAAQLGEVKAICDILFRAKINALDSIRRERVSSFDEGLTDYLVQTSTTNDLAVLTPYEISFRCFSTELASALSGFAGSPHCFIVKTVDVAPAPGTTAPGLEPAPGFVSTPMPMPVTPNYPAAAERSPISEAEAFARRYGESGPGRGGFPTPTPRPPAYYTVPTYTTTPAARGGLQTVLNEQLLRVTLKIDIVKLKPST